MREREQMQQKIWAELCVFLKPSASETKEFLWAVPKSLTNSEGGETLGISECSFTHLAGQVQQYGYVSKEGPCSPATTVKANQASSNLLFCELKIGDANQWRTEPAWFLPCLDKMIDKMVMNRGKESTSRDGTDGHSLSRA